MKPMISLTGFVLVLAVGMAYAQQKIAPAPAASPESLVIFDTFGTGKQQIEQRVPDKVNAPGSKWTMFRDDFHEDAWSYTGIKKTAQLQKPWTAGRNPGEKDFQPWLDARPETMFYLPTQRNGNSAVAISIASNGSYQKPPHFTISADLSGYRQANIALGFLSSVPPRSTSGDGCVNYEPDKKLYANFTGLVFVCWDHPVIDLQAGQTSPTIPDQFGFVSREKFDLQGAPNGSLTLFENGKHKLTINYTGTFDPTVPHRLSYDVDTASGAISNVKLQGSSSDYSAFQSKAFTDAATAYAALGNTPAPEGTPSQTPPHRPAMWVLAANFRVGVNLDPSLPLLEKTSPPPVASPAH